MVVRRRLAIFNSRVMPIWSHSRLASAFKDLRWENPIVANRLEASLPPGETACVEFLCSAKYQAASDYLIGTLPIRHDARWPEMSRGSKGGPAKAPILAMAAIGAVPMAAS
jgi:hypothetical protein